MKLDSETSIYKTKEQIEQADGEGKIFYFYYEHHETDYVLIRVYTLLQNSKPLLIGDREHNGSIDEREAAIKIITQIYGSGLIMNFIIKKGLNERD